MYREINIGSFLKRAGEIPVVDVRTPAEFKQGRIPVAHNIPLFSNSERESIGITYKNRGSQNAVFKGLSYAGPKLGAYLKKALKLASGNRLMIHCWRGGMRSASMAWLFETAGIRCQVLKGGYKSFRTYVLSYLSGTFPFVVIGGMTGSGKSDVLRSLAASGEQVLDLESLAHHKGSAFGHLGEEQQNSNEQFENDIFWTLFFMDHTRTIWVEDESRNIGKNILPKGIYDMIRNAPMMFLDLPMEERINRLVDEYSVFPDEQLLECIQKISKRLGGKASLEAMEAIRSGDYANATGLILNYYDKTYGFGLSKREKDKIFRLRPGPLIAPGAMAEQIAGLARRRGPAWKLSN